MNDFMSRMSRGENAEETRKQIQEEELIDFIRDTIVRLDSLADRLEGYVVAKKDNKEGEESA